jgi:hypothetical protein
MPFCARTASRKDVLIVLRKAINHFISYYSLGVSMLDPNQFSPNNRLRAALEARVLIFPSPDVSPPRIGQIVSLKWNSFIDKPLELEPIFAYSSHRKCHLWNLFPMYRDHHVHGRAREVDIRRIFIPFGLTDECRPLDRGVFRNLKQRVPKRFDNKIL